jgi:hypothetical protein
VAGTILQLGNVSPVRSHRLPDGTVQALPASDMGRQITTVHFPHGADQREAAHRALGVDEQGEPLPRWSEDTPDGFRQNDRMLGNIGRVLSADQKRYALAIRDLEDLWWGTGTHSDQPPAWAASDDPAFAEAVAAWFNSEGGTCEVGEPDGWTPAEASEQAARHMARLQDGGAPPIGGGALESEWLPEEFSEAFRSRWREHELLTNAGRDALHAQHVGTAAQPAAFFQMAFANSATATTPAAGDTTLAGEITTAGGGLLRGAATYAHTTGTNTSTLTRTVTANGSDTLPVTISQDGVFNAASAGTLGYKTVLTPSTATLSASGDNLTTTHTLTIG